MQRVVLASSNAGKLIELRELLADSGIELIAQTELGIDDAEETGLTFVENAILKARHAARLSSLPALADDSGLCVRALGGAPGLYSARYAGKHGDVAANNRKLLDVMRDIPDGERDAHFQCSLVLLQSADDPSPLIAEGRWHGTILHSPRGNGGHGYDPLFLDITSGLGAAEMDGAEKNRISHRGHALNALRAQLRDQRRQGL